MAAIILPRKHYTQPQGRVEVAPEWSDGIVLLCNNDIRTNIVTGNPCNEVIGSPGELLKTEIYEDGGASYFNQPTSADGPTSSYLFFPGIKYSPPPFSIFLRVKNTSFNTLMSHGGASAGGGWAVSIQHNNSLRFTFGGIADYIVRQAFFPDTPEYINFVVVVTPGSLTAYRKEDQTTISVGSPNNSVRSGLSIYATHFGTMDVNVSNATNARIATAALWYRAMSATEARTLIENPYELFRADPYRIYSLPPVLTIPSLSNPGVIDITATSARPQVTLAY